MAVYVRVHNSFPFLMIRILSLLFPEGHSIIPSFLGQIFLEVRVHTRYALLFTIVPSLCVVLFSFIINAKVYKQALIFSQLDVLFGIFFSSSENHFCNWFLLRKWCYNSENLDLMLCWLILLENTIRQSYQ